MSELDIYDPPRSVKQAPLPKPPGFIRSKLTEYSNIVRTEIKDKREACASAEKKVLSTVKPVTKYIPITYDTVKRVSVIGLCTFSGLLQGRKSGGYRRILYPLFGFTGGNAACYPKNTYNVTSKTLTTTLPLAAIAGKVAVDGSSYAYHQAKKASCFIYDKVKEQFPEQPPEKSASKSGDEGVVEVLLVEEPAVAGLVASEVESIVSQAESVALEAESVALDVTAPGSELAGGTAEVDSSDKVIPLELLPLPAEVPPIEENLGMGDREHDDMYSTRSARS